MIKMFKRFFPSYSFSVQFNATGIEMFRKIRAKFIKFPPEYLKYFQNASPLQKQIVRILCCRAHTLPDWERNSYCVIRHVLHLFFLFFRSWLNTHILRLSLVIWQNPSKAFFVRLLNWQTTKERERQRKTREKSSKCQHKCWYKQTLCFNSYNMKSHSACHSMGNGIESVCSKVENNRRSP